jgi:hypothetical protein
VSKHPASYQYNHQLATAGDSGDLAGFAGFDGRRNPATIAVVEIFNNGLVCMAIVNFSVPDDVKAEFDKTFGGQNKSAVIADLMRRAVADAKLRKRRVDIFRTLTQRRAERPSLSDARVRASRTTGRS